MDANHRPPAGQPAPIPRLRGSTYFLLRRQHDGAGFDATVYRSPNVALADAAHLRAEGSDAFVEPVDRERARRLLRLGAGWDSRTVSSMVREVFPGGVPRAAMRRVLAAIAVDGRNLDRLVAGVTLREMGEPTLADARRVNVEACRAWLESSP